jgi:hypothetical protein
MHTYTLTHMLSAGRSEYVVRFFWREYHCCWEACWSTYAVRKCVYICMCAYAYIDDWTPFHVHFHLLYIYIHIYIYIYIYACRNMLIYICMYIYIYTYIYNISAHIYIYIYICIYIQYFGIYVYIYICIYNIGQSYDLRRPLDA